MFLNKKRNYHETIYNGAIGIKTNFWDSTIDMKSRLVGFLKQAQIRMGD